jgi:hypothetical protein
MDCLRHIPRQRNRRLDRRKPKRLLADRFPNVHIRLRVSIAPETISFDTGPSMATIREADFTGLGLICDAAVTRPTGPAKTFVSRCIASLATCEIGVAYRQSGPLDHEAARMIVPMPSMEGVQSTRYVNNRRSQGLFCAFLSCCKDSPKMVPRALKRATR